MFILVQVHKMCSIVKTHSGVQGKDPAAKRFFSHLGTQDSLSWHFSGVNYF